MATISAEAHEPGGRDARGDDACFAAGDRGDSASQASTRTRLLANLADIDGHVEFVEGLLARRTFDEAEHERVQEGLERVRRRQADPTVTMAVVGEFSVGKSSFINALLREELFETDVVQGTTTAPVVISYGFEPTSCSQHEGVMDFRLIQRPSEGFEHGFRHMMAVLPVQDPQMKVHHGAVGDCIEKLTHHLRIHCPEPGHGKVCLIF